MREEIISEKVSMNTRITECSINLIIAPSAWQLGDPAWCYEVCHSTFNKAFNKHLQLNALTWQMSIFMAWSSSSATEKANFVVFKDAGWNRIDWIHVTEHRENWGWDANLKVKAGRANSSMYSLYLC
jgi:hypothetical protein